MPENFWPWVALVSLAANLLYIAWALMWVAGEPCGC